MKKFGGECVLAADIDPNAIEVYLKNYGIDSGRNVRDIKDEDIPDHDVLCAGFPCQAFSKAGKQEGFSDRTRGTLFFEVVRFLRTKHPKFILLENVQNLVSHNHGDTFKTICGALRENGYRLTKKPLILSPYQFGVPQIRSRVYIPGIFDPTNIDIPLEISFSDLMKKSDNSIYSILDEDVYDESCKLPKHIVDVLNAWDEFHKLLKNETFGFPIWSSYFKETRIDPDFPDWKIDFIKKNQQLYKNNKRKIDFWLKKWHNLDGFNDTQRKFEWQCGHDISSIWEAIIQIRPSGVRVKRPDCFQALVALVQLPIIGKYRRTLTVREAARLQSFPEDFVPDDNRAQAFKQFGNSVNVKVIREIFRKLIEQ